MITLDQIKQLDIKVRKAIDMISSLKSENNMLQGKLDKYQLRIEELEILIDTFKEDQSEIEEGIIDTLKQLDILEDNIISNADNAKLNQESIEVEQEPENETSVLNDTESKENSGSSDTEIDDVQKSGSEDKSDNTEIELDIF